MNKLVNVKEIQLFLDLQGEPSRKDSFFTSTGHGHYAYVQTGVNGLLYNLLKEMSLWGGSTGTYKTKDYRYFSQFELDCADKGFFKSRTFAKLCHRYNVKFIILDDGDEYSQIMREFWDQMQRR